MKRRTPIFPGIIVIVVLAAIGFFAFSALAGGGQQEELPPTDTPIPTSTTIAGGYQAELSDLTPSASNTVAPTRTPVVDVVLPTMTPTPTQTPTQVLSAIIPTARPATATPIKTPTPAPPTETPTPVNTPTPTTPYSLQDITWQPNCAMILIKFYVTDANGNPVNGVVFRYETVDGMHTALSNPTGQAGNQPGMTDFTVSPSGTKAATWRVWVVDGSDSPQSERVDVTSNTTGCNGGDGHQVATVNFRKNY